MHGVFDEEEHEPVPGRHDSILTLSSTTLLAIFFGLVLLCGLFFGLGFAVGRYGPSESASAKTQPQPSAQTTAPAASERSKPSATAPNRPAPQQRAAASLPPSTAPSSGSGQYGQAAAQSVVHPALPSTQYEPPPAPGGGNKTAPTVASSSALMVQIAAVSHPEDAEVLVNALRRRGYAVAVHRDPLDSLIHVQIGPFNNRNDANAMRQKLLNDGYNAIVQP